jgi:hypothetical protein
VEREGEGGAGLRAERAWGPQQRGKECAPGAPPGRARGGQARAAAAAVERPERPAPTPSPAAAPLHPALEVLARQLLAARGLGVVAAQARQVLVRELGRRAGGRARRAAERGVRARCGRGGAARRAARRARRRGQAARPRPPPRRQRARRTCLHSPKWSSGKMPFSGGRAPTPRAPPNALMPLRPRQVLDLVSATCKARDGRQRGRGASDRGGCGVGRGWVAS